MSTLRTAASSETNLRLHGNFIQVTLKMLSKMLIVPSVSISDGVTETSAFDKLCMSSLLPLFFCFFVSVIYYSNISGYC